jgi:hypothetical protein
VGGGGGGGCVVVWLCGSVGGVVGVVGVGWFPLAFEHSKVCTLCDFGHLQFVNKYFFTNLPSPSRRFLVSLSSLSV